MGLLASFSTYWLVRAPINSLRAVIPKKSTFFQHFNFDLKWFVHLNKGAILSRQKLIHPSVHHKIHENKMTNQNRRNYQYQK